MTTRRQLFRKTFLGAALLAGGAAVPLSLRRTRLNATPPERPLQFFSAEEYAIFAAIAERVVALEPTAAADALELGAAGDLPLPEPLAEVAASRPPGPTAAQVNVAGKADAFLAPLDAQSAKDLKQLISLFDNALVSVLFGGPAAPFTQLSAGQQDTVLRDWSTSRLALRRTGYQALKRLAAAIYHGSPLTYASVGYPGPPVELVRSVLEAQAPQGPHAPGAER